MNRFTNKYNPTGFIDEHSYHSPEWFIRQADRYDNYKRGGTGIYVGEYAANNELAMAKYDDEKANNFYSALAEAAFLTGLERNGDVVRMSSYAPLFNLVDSTQWTHNLIDFNPTAVSRTANYLVQQLFGTYYGDTYLKTQSVLPDGVFTSSTTDGVSIFLKVVNTGEEAFPLTVETGRNSAVQYSLSAVKWAKNHLPFQGEAKTEVAVRTEELHPASGSVHCEIREHSVNVFVLK